MIKVVYVVRRRPDVAPEEFRRYWRDEHGPLFRDRFARVLRARKYVQSHTVAADVNALLAQTRGMRESFDGITEVWWDSMEDLLEGFSTPEGQEASRLLAEDEARFIELAECSVFVTEEHTIFDWTDAGSGVGQG